MRNTHIPKRTVACCCRRLSKWWATGAPGVPLAATDHPLLAVGRPVRVSVELRPRQVEDRHRVPDRLDRRPGRAHDVEELELGGVVGVAAVHPVVAGDEL